MKRLYIILSIILLIHPSVYAQRIGFTLWNGWVGKDGSGFGYEIFKTVNNEIDVKPEELFFPFKRALVEYSAKTYDCYFGLNSQTMWKLLKIEVVETDPIVRSYLVFYTLKSSRKISSFSQLKGKTIGIVRGTDFEMGEFNRLKDVTISKVATSIQNIKKLKFNRIDTYLGYYPDAGALKELHFDTGFMLHPSDVTLNCHPSGKNRHYISQFNKGLSAIRQNGKYDEIFTDYFGSN